MVVTLDVRQQTARKQNFWVVSRKADIETRPRLLTFGTGASARQLSECRFKADRHGAMGTFIGFGLSFVATHGNQVGGIRANKSLRC